MAVIHYTAKVEDARLLKLPEEATALGLKPGDEVEVSVFAVPSSAENSIEVTDSQKPTPLERAKAYRAWAENHPRNTPLLSEEAVRRENMCARVPFR